LIKKIKIEKNALSEQSRTAMAAVRRDWAPESVRFFSSLGRAQQTDSSMTAVTSSPSATACPTDSASCACCGPSWRPEPALHACCHRSSSGSRATGFPRRMSERVGARWTARLIPIHGSLCSFQTKHCDCRKQCPVQVWLIIP
jgi:hypothetical protein